MHEGSTLADRTLCRLPQGRVSQSVQVRHVLGLLTTLQVRAPTCIVPLVKEVDAVVQVLRQNSRPE